MYEYPIISVPSDASERPEQLGTKFKFWFYDGARILTLYKEGRPGTGENWAEKVCAELATCLDVPHAAYDLAQWRERHGVITQTFVPEGARLVLGNEIMGRVIRGYDHTARHRAWQHSLGAVTSIMRRPALGMPLGYAAPADITTALHVFLGYLMLDALVANQDRHHENWALISWPGRSVTLAPTFDHASSLGRNELDETRVRRLETEDKGYDVAAYCARAKSAFYPRFREAGALSTIEAFQEAARVEPKAATYWLSRLKAVDLSTFMEIVSRVPESEMSDPAKRFAVKMLEINRDRLLRLPL